MATGCHFSGLSTMDTLSTMLWYKNTNQQVKFSSLFESVPENIRKSLYLAIKGIEISSDHISVNSFTTLTLNRRQYSLINQELLDKAVLLEYCIRMDNGQPCEAYNFLNYGTSIIGEKLNWFLSNSNKNARLLRQFVCLGL
jgi:hypothetical protein